MIVSKRVRTFRFTNVSNIIKHACLVQCFVFIQMDLLCYKYKTITKVQRKLLNK